MMGTWMAIQARLRLSPNRYLILAVNALWHSDNDPIKAARFTIPERSAVPRRGIQTSIQQRRNLLDDRSTPSAPARSASTHLIFPNPGPVSSS